MSRFKFLAQLFGNVSPLLLAISLGAGLVASVAFIAGTWVRFSAIAMLTALQLLMFAIPRFRIVAFPYITIMLIVTAVFYQSAGRFGERSILNDRRIWHLPLFLGIYTGFSVSGISKFFFDLWNSGNMVGGQCTLSLMATLFGSGFCEHLPLGAIAFLVASVEVMSLPLAIFPRSRALIWTVSTLLHFAIIFFAPQLPARTGVFIMQLFLFDPAWINEARRR